MTLNKASLRKFQESMWIRKITDEQRDAILERFGKEPEPYEWSWQDITKQIENYLEWGAWEKPTSSNGTCTRLPPGVDF